MNIDRILAISQFKTITGYSIHGRQLLKNLETYCNNNNLELDRKNINWNVRMHRTFNEEIDDIDLGKVYKNELKAKDNTLLFMHNVPAEWPPYRMADYQIGYYVFETTKYPEYWTQLMNNFDEIWVPNLFNALIARKSGIKTTIKIIPFSHVSKNGLDVDKSFEDNTKIKSNMSDVNILLDGQWLPYDRKGIKKSLSTYIQSIDNVETSLFAKIWLLSLSMQDTYFLIEKIENILNEYNIDWQDMVNSNKNIVMINDFLSSEKMNCLKSKVSDIILGLSCGEGMWLTGLEATISGIPIITTNFSAMTDYLIDYGNLVDYELVNVSQSIGKRWYNPKAKWANPDIEDAIEKLNILIDRVNGNDEELEKYIGEQKQYSKKYWSAENCDRLFRIALNDSLNKEINNDTYLYQRDSEQFLSFDDRIDELSGYSRIQISELEDE